MSAVGTAVSPFPRLPTTPSLLFPPARPVGVVSDKIYPYFIANAATDAPTRLRINYSISVRRSALRFCMLECDRENNFALMAIT